MLCSRWDGTRNERLIRQKCKKLNLVLLREWDEKMMNITTLGLENTDVPLCTSVCVCSLWWLCQRYIAVSPCSPVLFLVFSIIPFLVLNKPSSVQSTEWVLKLESTLPACLPQCIHDTTRTRHRLRNYTLQYVIRVQATGEGHSWTELQRQGEAKTNTKHTRQGNVKVKQETTWRQKCRLDTLHRK